MARRKKARLRVNRAATTSNRLLDRHRHRRDRSWARAGPTRCLRSSHEGSCSRGA
jgi:hypothetical protein